MKENEVSTIVGSNVHLTGTLKDDSDIVVHGSVDGEVRSEQNVVIGDSAKIKGPITAQNISISGGVTGTITATDKLEIHPTGHVEGNIKAKDLVIHSGAFFTGKSEMMTDQGTTSEAIAENNEQTEPETEEPELEKPANEDEDDSAIIIEEDK
jgi:cytoskeletal protein CcmA (bactofilin family)